jgi:hypothetical protein
MELDSALLNGPYVDTFIVENDEIVMMYTEMEIICNEIRNFVVILYKFFCHQRQNCNWDVIRNLLSDIDLTLQTMLNKLFLNFWEREENREASTNPHIPSYSDEPFLRDSSTLSDISSYNENQRVHYNQTVMDEVRGSMEQVSQISRAAKSLNEIVKIIDDAERNLHRARNFSKINAIAFDE